MFVEKNSIGLKTKLVITGVRVNGRRLVHADLGLSSNHRRSGGIGFSGFVLIDVLEVRVALRLGVGNMQRLSQELFALQRAESRSRGA